MRVCVCVCTCVLHCFNHVRLFATLRTTALQAPLSMGILQARILEGVTLPCLLNPGMEPRSPALQAESLPSEPPGCTWINFVGIQFPAELQRHCLLSSSIRLLDSLFFHCRLPSGNCVFNSSHENVSRGGGFFFFFYHSCSWVFLTGRCLEPWEIFFYHVLCYFLLSISFLLLFSKTVSQMLGSGLLILSFLLPTLSVSWHYGIFLYFSSLEILFSNKHF